MKDDKFISIKLSKNNLDTYFIRKSIFEVLKNQCASFKEVFLDVGCGKMPYREFIRANSNINEYIGLDIETALEYDASVKPDYTWDGLKMPFEDNSFDSCMATEVLEHCPDPTLVLDEIQRVLKPSGVFFFTVPFLWNLHEVPHDEFRYTPFALERLLKASGFVDIQIKSSGGWHASMAQMMGLWVLRSKMNLQLRRILKIVCLPIYKYLLKVDKPPISFKEGQMITNIWGVCRSQDI